MAKIEWDSDRVVRIVKEKTDDVTERAAKRVLRDAQALAKRHRVTGNYEAGLKMKKSIYPNGGHIVKATAPHSFLLEVGGRNIRKPKRKKMLKFWSKKYNKWIFTKEVKPMPKTPILRPALHKNETAIQNMFRDIL